MAFYGDPASAMAAQLKQLEEENVRLRNELMDAADERFNLQATMVMIEAEAQHKASQQVIGLQSELNFKVRSGRAMIVGRPLCPANGAASVLCR